MIGNPDRAGQRTDVGDHHLEAVGSRIAPEKLVWECLGCGERREDDFQFRTVECEVGP